MKLVQDSILLQRFRDGESNALHEVYLHYAPQLYSFLRQGFSFSSGEQWFRVPPLDDPVEQENLVQETFVRCFRQHIRERYDGQRPFLAYLQRTCRNLLLEERRRAQPMVLDHEVREESSEDHDALSPEQKLEHQQLVTLLEDFLSHCSAREQEVFRAIYEEGDSQAQAAERLGLGRTQVRTSLTKLRQGLLQHLKESGYLETIAQSSSRGWLPWEVGLVWAPLIAELFSR
ncbi:MAG: sigma-70 family RNA polymerase sigma factor [Deltaproteobacteria bacterium]|nr:MAG: sigma-70 family RNA polymerase sigma factor [Deltaproteobacteria bacterium]